MELLVAIELLLMAELGLRIMDLSVGEYMNVAMGEGVYMSRPVLEMNL